MAESNKEDGDAGEAFLTINDVPIYFSEDWGTGIGGGLWSTGLAMAKYFEHHAEEVIDNLKRLSRVKYLRQARRRSDEQNDNGATRGISAIELGSGNGFLSACLLALTANQSSPLKELVVTDMADHLSLMATTLKANSHVWNELTIIEPVDDIDGENDGKMTKIPSVHNRQQTNPAEVIVAELLWGESPSSKNHTGNGHSQTSDIQNKQYDFIFGTDLAYRNSLHEPLISSLLRLSHQHTLILIGVTMTDTQPRFFDSLTKAGFRYEKMADHLLEREFRGSNFGLFAIQRRQQRCTFNTGWD